MRVHKIFFRQAKSQWLYFASTLLRKLQEDSHLQSEGVNLKRQSLGFNITVSPAISQNEEQGTSRMTVQGRPTEHPGQMEQDRRLRRGISKNKVEMTDSLCVYVEGSF